MNLYFQDKTLCLASNQDVILYMKVIRIFKMQPIKNTPSQEPADA